MKIAKGDRLRHSSYRGIWTVVSAGEKRVTLKSSLPWAPTKRVSRDVFAREGWSKAG